MADRICLKHYPPGMPAEIDPDRFGSIPDLFDKTGVTLPLKRRSKSDPPGRVGYVVWVVGLVPAVLEHCRILLPS